MMRSISIVWECVRAGPENIGGQRTYLMLANRRTDKPHVDLSVGRYAKTGYLLDMCKLSNGSISWHVRQPGGQKIGGSDHVHVAMKQAEQHYLTELYEIGVEYGIVFKHPLLEKKQ